MVNCNLYTLPSFKGCRLSILVTPISPTIAVEIGSAEHPALCRRRVIGQLYDEDVDNQPYKQAGDLEGFPI